MQVKIDAQKKNNAKWMSLGGLHFSLQLSIPTVCVAAWSEVTPLDPSTCLCLCRRYKAPIVSNMYLKQTSLGKSSFIVFQ